MTTFIVAFIIGLVAFLIKLTIDLYAFMTIVRKEPAVLVQKNSLYKNYQFLKGLY